MSNLKKNKKKKSKKSKLDKMVFVYCSGNGVVDDIYKASMDLDDPPNKVSCLYLRVDDLPILPLDIRNDPNRLSAIINNEYQINFSSEVAEEDFFNDLFYFIEEFHNTKKKYRITSKRKIINLEDELDTLKRRTNE